MKTPALRNRYKSIPVYSFATQNILEGFMIRRASRNAFVALLISTTCPMALSILGCSAVPSAVSPTPTSPTANLSQNWQFQTGTTIGPFTQAATSLSMAGAMQIQGTQVTGIFQTVGICYPTPYQTISYTGTYNPSTGALSLGTDTPVDAQMTLPTDTTKLATGVMGGAGEMCALALANAPSVGMQIPTLTGTFTGAVSGVSSGTATLTITQAATANSSGQFPLTGSLQFSGMSCSSTTSLSGYIIGASYSLTSSTGSTVTLTGYDNAGGTTLPSASIAFANGPCGSGTATSYTGTLTQQ